MVNSACSTVPIYRLPNLLAYTCSLNRILLSVYSVHCAGQYNYKLSDNISFDDLGIETVETKLINLPLLFYSTDRPTRVKPETNLTIICQINDVHAYHLALFRACHVASCCKLVIHVCW